MRKKVSTNTKYFSYSSFLCNQDQPLVNGFFTDRKNRFNGIMNTQWTRSIENHHFSGFEGVLDESFWSNKDCFDFYSVASEVRRQENTIQTTMIYSHRRKVKWSWRNPWQLIAYVCVGCFLFRFFRSNLTDTEQWTEKRIEQRKAWKERGIEIMYTLDWEKQSVISNVVCYLDEVVVIDWMRLVDVFLSVRVSDERKISMMLYSRYYWKQISKKKFSCSMTMIGEERCSYWILLVIWRTSILINFSFSLFFVTFGIALFSSTNSFDNLLVCQW